MKQDKDNSSLHWAGATGLKGLYVCVDGLVRERGRVRVRVCGRACVRACARACVCVCVCVCGFLHADCGQTVVCLSVTQPHFVRKVGSVHSTQNPTAQIPGFGDAAPMATVLPLLGRWELYVLAHAPY